MKKIFFFCAALSGMLSFSGCSDDFQYDTTDGEGRVLLRPVINTDVEVKSRQATTDELAETATIWISNSKGVVRKYTGINNVPAAGVNLVSDNYVAEVWAGDSVPASFDDRQYKGLEKFTVSKGTTQQVEIVCKIANSVVEVNYTDGIEELISDPMVTVGHKAGSLEYAGFEMGSTPGYFMMPTFDPNLAYTLTATNVATGQEVKLTGVIENAQPATKYILNVSHNEGEVEEFGGALVKIEVDETEIEKKDEFVFYSAPTIKGHNFTGNKITGKRGSITEKKLWVAATSPLANVIVSCPEFEQLLGIGGDDFDVLNMTDDIKAQLENLGFSYQLFTHTENQELSEVERNFQEMKLTFDETFMALFPDGDYNITVTATDENKRTASAVYNIVVSDDKVTTTPIKAADVWPTTATLTGTIVQENMTGLGFQYRELGAQQWETVLYSEPSGIRRRAQRRALAIGSTYSVELTGLNPSTTYEYRAICDGFEGAVNTFTTWADERPQLPNAGFEEWNTSSKAYLVCTDENNMFWDSGNHGSATMNKNVTQPDEAIKHGGNYSAKLMSQFVGVGIIGKFAAGNLFVGKYLDTDGTDGVLGFGRPFTGRPKALKGYVRYEPGKVEYTHAKAPDIVKGQLDKGQIYVALTDNSNDATEKGFTAPFIIKTKTAQLFDRNASNVIAYGQMTFNEATEGSGMVEFTIPLEYRDRECNDEVAPSYIVLVCSASKGGDYFAGGASTMWLDDFELVY